MENNLELLEELRQKAAKLLEAKDQGTEIVEETSTEWETRHQEFVDAGNNAKPEHIDSLLKNLKDASKKASQKRGVMNKIFGKKSNGDLARTAYGADHYHASISKLRNSAKDTEDRKTLGQHITYAKTLLRGVNEAQEDTSIDEADATPTEVVAPTEDIDVSAIFAGEDLSEEFKTKATAIFEAAVAQRVKAIEESYATALDEYKAEHDQKSLTESEELVEGLTEKVDGYLDYVVEQWITDNEIALERGIKADLFESFMSGMKSLFEEHHINVPEQELEVLDELRSVNEELESKMDEMLEENVALRKELKDIAKHVSISEAAEGLSELDTERFVELAEGLSYDTEDGFKNKLAAIRENFFQKTAENQKQLSESVVTDEPVIIEEETRTPQIDPSINAYVSALTRNKI